MVHCTYVHLRCTAYHSRCTVLVSGRTVYTTHYYEARYQLYPVGLPTQHGEVLCNGMGNTHTEVPALLVDTGTVPPMPRMA